MEHRWAARAGGRPWVVGARECPGGAGAPGAGTPVNDADFAVVIVNFRTAELVDAGLESVERAREGLRMISETGD